jgi:hypothetical protein
MPTRLEVARHMFDCGQGKHSVIAVSIWTVEDVFTMAEKMEAALTVKEAEEILEEVHRKQDANIGINWDVIEQTILSH